MQTIEKIIVNGQEFALSDPGAVAYDESQTLTAEEKSRARENIGAAALGEGGASALIVTVTEDMADHTPQQIYDHVLSGGTAVLLCNEIFFGMTRASADQAEFSTATDENLIDYIKVNQDGSVARMEHIFASDDGFLSDTAKALLVAFMRKCVTEGSTDTLIDQFEAEIGADSGDSGGDTGGDSGETPEPVTLSSISAVCAETEAVEGTATGDLTITVTAHYSDGTSQTVTDFSLTPATLVLGTNTVVITYSGKTTSVDVLGTAASAKWLNNGTFTLTNQNVVGREFAMTVTNNNHVVIEPNENTAQSMSYPQNVVDISNGLTTTEYGSVARLEANDVRLHLSAGDVVETTVSYTSFSYQNRCGLYMLTPEASGLDGCIALIPYPSAAQTDLVQSNTITIESDTDVAAILFTPRSLNTGDGKKDEFELSIKVNGSEILGVI